MWFTCADFMFCLDRMPYFMLPASVKMTKPWAKLLLLKKRNPIFGEARIGFSAAPLSRKNDFAIFQTSPSFWEFDFWRSRWKLPGCYAVRRSFARFASMACFFSANLLVVLLTQISPDGDGTMLALLASTIFFTRSLAKLWYDMRRRLWQIAKWLALDVKSTKIAPSSGRNSYWSRSGMHWNHFFAYNRMFKTENV